MTTSAEDAIALVDKYKEEVIQQGERIVRVSFPSRIIELNALLEQPPFNSTDLRLFHSDLNIPVPDPVFVSAASGDLPQQTAPGKRRRTSAGATDDASNSEIKGGSKVYVLPLGESESNKAITEIIQTLKPILRRLMDEVNMLKMWITYLIPKIEDGNNFGVSIQEETLGEVSSTETDVATYFYELSRYYSVRGRLVAKVAKYPHLDDYRRAVQELDEKQFVQLRLTLIEIRNRYSTLQDIINKNIEKIKAPRTSNSVHSMY